MNNYDDLFKPNFTTKQVTMLYCRLIDDVRGNDEEMKKLDEATSRAYSRALDKAFKESEEAMKNGYAILC